MKKILLLLLLVLLSCLTLVACGPAEGPAGDSSLAVTSCTQVAFADGVRTYRLTFSDGSTADFDVKDGEKGNALTVVSCAAVATSKDGVTTWRITFSDGSVAEFTVNNATQMGADIDWEELLLKLEQMNDLLTAEVPDMSVGNSTVSDPLKTSAGTYAAPNKTTGDYITGLGFPLTKNVMFGDSDTIVAMRLNRYRVFDRGGLQITEGKFPVEIQIRSFTDSHLAFDTSLVATYTTEMTLDPTVDYIDLDVDFSFIDFYDFGDDEYFMMVINILSDAEYALRCSKNETFHFPTEEKQTLSNGSAGAYLYSGYVVNGIAGKKPSNSYSLAWPDIFFSTAMKTVPVDLSGFVSGGGASGTGNGDGTAPELDTDHLLQLPDTFDLVVGDTFEMYYKGITLCLDSDAFAYELRFTDGKNRGNNYKNKYVWTPTEADVGVHGLTVAIRDNYGRILDEGVVDLNVVRKPVSPASERTYLFIGASLVQPGHFPKEVIRRLTSTAATTTSGGVVFPAGDGITGIKTIGSIKSGDGADDVRYEGYGGWSASSYTTAYNQRPYFVYINGSFGGLTITQHSHYTDANGQLWKVEHITDTRLKLIAVSSVGGNVATSCQGLNVKNGTVPASGTLTWAAGNPADAKTITYTSTTKAEGNPFWSTELGKNDFRAYAEKHGAERIDEVVILLGWNSTGVDAIERESMMRKLVDSILADFPDCHVTLCGLQGPSRDGFGVSYGISWNYYEKLTAVFETQAAYMRIANDEKYDGHVSFVHLGGQFDELNSYPTSSVATNTRDPEKIYRENNGVHPAKIGYYQIADAVYRHLVTRLQGGN